jgi:SAM-dependent methyltransferase
MDDGKLEKAEATWDAFDIPLARRVAWSSLDLVSKSTQMDLPQGFSITTLLHFQLLERQGEADKRVGCALVCGDMSAEKFFFEANDYISIDKVYGYDISGVSLGRVDMTVNFIPNKVDVNRIDLPINTFDIIVGHQGLHHIENISNIFFQSKQSLKPGGLMFVSEWIGPEYLQIPLTNKIVSIFLLYLLFPTKKIRTTHMGLVKGFGYLTQPKESYDPSEACNSEVLESSLLRYFSYTNYKRSGGLCYPIFEGISQNINQNYYSNKIKLQIILKIELILTRLGVIRPLFLNAICAPRDDDRQTSKKFAFRNFFKSN